jgi:hypothetical protein
MDDEKSKESKGDAAKGATASEDPSIPIDFSTFVLSLSSSAAYHLGLAPHPEGEGEGEGTNLTMAKQTIDILGILQEKTKGNLTGEEERILSEVLYNLRIAFVRASQSPSS